MKASKNDLVTNTPLNNIYGLCLRPFNSNKCESLNSFIFDSVTSILWIKRDKQQHQGLIVDFIDCTNIYFYVKIVKSKIY